MALFNFNSEERKTKKMIRESEEKLTKLKNILDNDISNIKSQIDEIKFSIGKTVYQNKDKDLLQLDLQSFFKNIEDLEDKIKELEDKKAKLDERYNEELSILYKTVEDGQVQNLTVCPQCNAPRNPGSDFCTNCGYNFKPQSGNNDVCPQCNAPKNPGSDFCSNCGYNFKPQNETGENSELCPQCNTPRVKDADFCINCGHKFK